MAKRKRPELFTKKELKVMEALWNNDGRPMTKYDIAEKLDTEPTQIASMLQKLNEKKAIKQKGSVPRKSRLANLYLPAIEHKEYLASVLGFMRASDLFTTNDLMCALIDIAKEEDPDFMVNESTE